MRQFKPLFPFIRTNLWRYVLGLAWLAAVDLLQLVIPRLLGNLADDARLGLLSPARLGRYAGLIVLTALGVAGFRFLWRYYINSTARRLEFWLRERLFTHLLTLDADFYDHHRTGDLMAHATNDVDAVRRALGMGLVLLTDSLLLTLATVLLMVTTVDWRLTVLALLPLPLVAVAVTGLGRLVHVRFRLVQQAFSGLTELVQEDVSGIRLIQVYARQDQEQERFRAAARRSVAANLHLARISALMYPLASVIAAVSFAILLAYGGRLVLAGRISLGDFVAFNSYLAGLTWPMLALGWVLNLFQRAGASMARLNELFAARPAIVDDPGAVSYQPRGEIAARNLSFTYPGRPEPALQNINFNLPAGGLLALVGRTGSGKSTLVQLLLRLYDPPRGTLFLDGIDIREIRLESLRRHVAYVPQDNFLFSASIAENISFGGAFTREQVEQAARAACIYEEALSFPQGLDTVVGERGVTLSGGQRQRVALARALIRDPAVLLLDDCLSAVDSRTERQVLHNLANLRKGKTTVLVAHRLFTVEGADLILVLEDGRVVEQGKHRQLLRQGGLYRHIYTRQALETRLAEETPAGAAAGSGEGP